MKKLLVALMVVLSLLCNTQAIGSGIHGFGSPLGLVAGTYVNGYLCYYTAAGTLFNCDIDPASYQTADSDLTTIAELIPVAGKCLMGDSTPKWILSPYTFPAASCTSGYVLGSDGTNMVCKSTVSFSALNLSSLVLNAQCTAENNPDTCCTGSGTGTCGVFLSYGTQTAPTAEGQIYHNSSTDVTTIGDGAAANELVKTAKTVITKSEYLPIRYMEDDDSVTAPAAVAEISTSTMVGRAFDKDADEGGVFWWQVPLDYSAGIKYRVYYSPAANASADETAAFSLAGCSVGNSDAIACSEGTAVVVTDELGTDDDAGELMITDWSSAVTVTNITAGEMAKLLFIRDVSEDDYASGDLIVVGIEIKYQAKLNASSDY